MGTTVHFRLALPLLGMRPRWSNNDAVNSCFCVYLIAYYSLPSKFLIDNELMKLLSSSFIRDNGFNQIIE